MRLAEAVFAALGWFVECRLRCELGSRQDGGALAKPVRGRQTDDLPVIGVL